MRTIFLALLTLLMGIEPQAAIAQSSTNQMESIVKNVKDVCAAPGKSGQYWEVKGGGQADAGIKVKLLGSAGIKGNVEFTKKEWDGIQQVLREHQANENARYRDCVERLTPLFLQKFVPEPHSMGTNCDAVYAEWQSFLRAAGSNTDTITMMIAFQHLALGYGCVGDTYTADVKDFVFKVTPLRRFSLGDGRLCQEFSTYLRDNRGTEKRTNQEACLSDGLWALRDEEHGKGTGKDVASVSGNDWFRRANSLWNGQRYDPPELAIQYLTKAMTIDGETSQALANRGLAYVDAGRLEDAIADLTKALALDPTDTMAYQNRGVAYFRSGQIGAARSDWIVGCSLGHKQSCDHLSKF